MRMETMPRAEREAPKKPASPEALHIDFTPENFNVEVDRIRQTAEHMADSDATLNKAQRDSKYLELIHRFRDKYLQIADRQKEPQANKTAVQAMLGTFILSQHAIFGGLEKRGASSLPLEFEENISVQSSIASYLTELNDNHRNNPAEAVRKAAIFWNTQETYLGRYFHQNPKGLTFDGWKNGILRDVALQWVIREECGWDIVPHDDIRVDAINKIDLVGLSSKSDIAYLFQLKPMEKKTDGAWNMEQVFPVAGEPSAYADQASRGMYDFVKDNELQENQTKGFLMRISASGEYINKQTGMPSPQFAREVAGQLRGIDEAANQSSAA